jgi:DNA segregation ATPase FtsK/SpoIIIE-like protein
MPQAWKAAPEVAKIARQIISESHPHLAETRVEFRFFDEEKKKLNHSIFGYAEIISGDKAYMATWMPDQFGEIVQPESFREPEPFFMISIWEKAWRNLMESQRLALVDHELCHCIIELDERNNPVLRLVGHDIEEFNAIVARHGLWMPHEEAFVKSIRTEQNSLFEPKKDSTAENHFLSEIAASVGAIGDIEVNIGDGKKVVARKSTTEENKVELTVVDGDRHTPIVASSHKRVAAKYQGMSNGVKCPPLNLLDNPEKLKNADENEVSETSSMIEAVLKDFRLKAEIQGVSHGPAVTRYEAVLNKGTHVRKVKALSDNIAMSLKAESVRIQAPIPGRDAVGFEIPNKVRQIVHLSDICGSEAFWNASALNFAVGMNLAGDPVISDLAAAPHFLVAGATGSGKSIALNSIITSLLMRNDPSTLRFVMIDPKRVELVQFDGIPHLMCPVVSQISDAPAILRAITREMDRRYMKFEEAKVRNIDSFNESATDRLPYIAVVIDELADLILMHKKEVETEITRIGQLARAAGIHLIVATQRPSVDVITDVIKANIPSRMGLTVASGVDSKVILDSMGAERLIGKGDMLLSTQNTPEPIRVQGCLVTEKEVTAICEYWKNSIATSSAIDGFSMVGGIGS